MWKTKIPKMTTLLILVTISFAASQVDSSPYTEPEGTCIDGDVKLVDDGTPLIYWGNQWLPICGHYFWDNQDGARLFCQKMGYHLGEFSGRGSGEKYLMDSFRVGKCSIQDNWESCTGGCNDYQSGDACSNNKNAKCDQNQRAKITIECSGGESTATTSCGETAFTGWTKLCTSCDVVSNPKEKYFGHYTLIDCKKSCMEHQPCHAIDYGKGSRRYECYHNYGGNFGKWRHTQHSGFDAYIIKD